MKEDYLERIRYKEPPFNYHFDTHNSICDVPNRPLSAKLEKIHFNEASFHPDVMLNVLGEENSKLKTLEIEDCEGFDSVILPEAFFTWIISGFIQQCEQKLLDVKPE